MTRGTRNRKSPVIIRPLALADCDAFLAAVARSRVLHRPWVSPPANRAAFRRYGERHASETHRGFLVIDLTSGELAGVINLHIVRGPLQSAFVGYYAFAGFERRGFMREGMKQVLAHAFAKLKLHRIEANIQPDNRASRKLVRSLGFVREGFSRRYLKIRGRWQDHERWALLAEDWRPGKTRGEAVRTKTRRAAVPSR
jgi:[ribosomal protein S5]-alanine N-acetyltransferase